VSESAVEYSRRLESYVEGKDPIGMQREAPHTVARLLQGVPEPKLKQRPAPGKWSVAEIVAHLAEDELATGWRYRQILEHDYPHLESFDQDLWAALGDYGSWSAAEALALYRMLREANLRMLARLTPEQWQRAGMHRERGKLTVRELSRHMAAHDENHIRQIKKILAD
jgi:uncharacterized damage-inducible protein DinB